MSFSRSLPDERDETLDALEESLIAVNLPGRQPLYLSDRERAPAIMSDHYGSCAIRCMNLTNALSGDKGNGFSGAFAPLSYRQTCAVLKIATLRVR